MEKELTQERLDELLSYNENTGEFIWKKNRYKVKAGDVAGCITGNGYVHIRVDGRIYLGHRLAWFRDKGEWPKNQIDHCDQNRANNILSNLREVTHAGNQQNRSLNKNNKSGFTGVSWYKALNKWQAQINVEGKIEHLGYFSNKEDAIVARQAANIKYNFHLNHGKMTTS